MANRVCSPTTRICAMGIHWNGYKGGENVRPRAGMMNVWEYNDEEKQICFKNHFEKKHGIVA